MEFEDKQLVLMIRENNEDAKDFVVEKYKYIIDILLSKYKKAISFYGIDHDDIYQDSFVAFVNAINSFDTNKDVSLATYLTICIERKVQSCLKSASTTKNKINQSALSMETYYNSDSPLMDYISDSNLNNPLNKVSSSEEVERINNLVKKNLSITEYEVYTLLVNGFNYHEIAKILNKNSKQIDNSIQRLKSKIKKVVENNH